MAEADFEVPCIPFPEPKNITIPLPFGAELKTLTDLSQGVPTDCALAHSLMLQISPMLAGMTCILRVLKVLSALKDTIITEPPFFNVFTIGDLVSALAELSSCFLLIDPIQICKMVAAILDTILAYVGCLIESFESIWNFQIGIDLNAAQGNPVLLASLGCAQENSQKALNGVMSSMEGIQPLLDMVNMVLGIVGMEPIAMPPLSAETPSLADLAPDVDPLAEVKAMRDVLLTARNALPC